MGHATGKLGSLWSECSRRRVLQRLLSSAQHLVDDRHERLVHTVSRLSTSAAPHVKSTYKVYSITYVSRLSTNTAPGMWSGAAPEGKESSGWGLSMRRDTLKQRAGTVRYEPRVTSRCGDVRLLLNGAQRGGHCL